MDFCLFVFGFFVFVFFFLFFCKFCKITYFICNYLTLLFLSVNVFPHSHISLVSDGVALAISIIGIYIRGKWLKDTSNWALALHVYLFLASGNITTHCTDLVTNMILLK